MGTFFKTYESHPEKIRLWEEVKRRAMVDALDTCGGNYALAAQLLGIGRTTIYRMARVYNYQPPTAKRTHEALARERGV
jgi:transcriptional regulator of acetoin/glycerol metabolism